jgi:hypothetical protein
MTMKYIYHHLGLGDHITCNGMVRHFCKKYDNVVLFCYTHCYKNVSYMYRDLNNLEIFNFDTEVEIVNFIENNRAVKNNLIKPGFDNLKYYAENKINFDVGFYELAELDHQIRFSEFYFERDFDKEELLYNELNPNNEKYIFIHDDPDRGYVIDMDKINTQYKIIKNDTRFLIFDYIKLLENAEEIHCMQSSMKDLINSYELKAKLYFHNYVRKLVSTAHTLGINDWITYE